MARQGKGTDEPARDREPTTGAAGDEPDGVLAGDGPEGVSAGDRTPASTRRQLLKASGATAAALTAGSAGVGGSALGATTADGIPTPRLHVDGKYVLDPNDQPVKLRGVAVPDIYWMNTNRDWLGKDAREMLRWATDERRGWYTRTIRLTVRPEEVDAVGGIQSYVDGHLRPAVDFLASRDVYAVIDNHMISDYDTSAADTRVRDFWSTVAPEFADDEHVVYELFNEPVNPRGNDLESWNTWRETAMPWVDLVREHAPSTPLLVGGPYWSQKTYFAAQNPFPQNDIVYAAHMYTPEYIRPWEEVWGDAVSQLPYVNTEFGWDGTGDVGAFMTATTDSYGVPLREFMDAHDNVGWLAWCFSRNWNATFFDHGWNLLGGQNHHGQFIKDWLADVEGQLNPTTTYSDATAPSAPTDLVAEATQYTVDVSWTSASDAGGSGLSHYDVLLDGTVEKQVAADSTATDSTSTTVRGLDPATTYEVAVRAVDVADNRSPADATTVETLSTTAAQEPYGGRAILPGRVQAEDYDEGGQGISYYDTFPGNAGETYRSGDMDVGTVGDSGYSVGWTGPPEWLEYSVQVETGGTHAVTARIAADGPGSFHLEVDGETVVETSFEATGGWSSWQTIDVGTAEIPEGEHLLRFVPDTNKFNVDWLEFVPEGATSDGTAPPAPSGLAATSTTESSVTVSWDPVTDDGAGLSYYVVSLGGNREATVPAGTTTATIEDLSPGTGYQVGVAAVDAAANASEPATALVSTAGSVGDRAYSPSDALTVLDFDGDDGWPGSNELGSWADAGSFVNDGGGVITEALRLEYDNSGWFESDVGQDVSAFDRIELVVRGASGGEESDFVLQVNDTSGLLADLTDDAIGTRFGVVAVDLADLGVSGTVDRVRCDFWQGEAGTIYVDEVRFAAGERDTGTDTTAPDAPTSLTVTDATSSTLVLDWDAATDDGTGVAEYQVYLNGFRDHTVPAGTTTTTVEGLEPGTTYDVAVEAVDGAGNRSAHATASATTTGATPTDTPTATPTDTCTADTAPAWSDGTAPADVDDDGVYEDFNGNCEFDSDDVVTFFQEIDRDGVQNNPSYYDANGNGNADFDDIVTLFQSL